MARKRMLDPHIWESAYDKRWTTDDFTVMAAAISAADDEGRGRVSMIIRNVGMMLSQRKFKKTLVKLKESLVIYDEIYFFLPNFLEYQTINRPKPSKLPEPNLLELKELKENNHCLSHCPSQKKSSEVKLSKVNLKEVKLREDEVNNENKTLFKNKNGKLNVTIPEEFIPQNYADNNHLKNKIEYILNHFTGLAPDKPTVINFFNLITDPDDQVSTPTAFSIFYQTCSVFSSFKPEKQNFGYLFTTVKGRIRDALILAREQLAQKNKAKEKEEVTNLEQNEGFDLLKTLEENMTAK